MRDQVEEAAEPRIGMAERFAADHREQQADHADDRGFGDLALAPHIHPHAHEHAERDGHGDGEVPHALSASALTNAMPRPASAITRMNRMAIAATKPVNGLISCLTMSGSDRPPRRTEAHRTIESCTAPARQHAGDQPDEAGRVAELRRQHRADQRARAGDGREVMAEHHPPAGRVVVRAVVFGMRRRLARVVQHPDLGREERAVVPVRDGQDAKRGEQYIQSMHRSTNAISRPLASGVRSCNQAGHWPSEWS